MPSTRSPKRRKFANTTLSTLVKGRELDQARGAVSEITFAASQEWAGLSAPDRKRSGSRNALRRLADRANRESDGNRSLHDVMMTPAQAVIEMSNELGFIPSVDRFEAQALADIITGEVVIPEDHRTDAWFVGNYLGAVAAHQGGLEYGSPEFELRAMQLTELLVFIQGVEYAVAAQQEAAIYS